MKILIQDYKLKDITAMGSSIIKTILQPIKIINFVKIKISKIFKLTKLIGYPINILVEPTRFCNYECPQCPRQTYAEIKNLKKMELTVEDFKNILSQIGKYLITIRFWHYGEPLLHPDIHLIVKLAKKYNIFTAISSNCSILTEEVSQRLIDAKLDYLLISLNAATKETYKKFTNQDNFYKVVENIKKLSELKKTLGKSLPFINLQFIIMKENHHEINIIKQISKEIGVDKLSFKYPGFKREELGLEEQKFQLKDIDKQFFCSLPFEETVISANGDVTPCAPDMQNKYVMGNILKQRFKDIWNAHKYQNFRNKVKKDINSIDICAVCPKKNNPDFFIDI